MMPFFEGLFITPLRKTGIAYETDSHITKVHIPIIIFHAVDDGTVPHALGVKVSTTVAMSPPFIGHIANKILSNLDHRADLASSLSLYYSYLRRGRVGGRRDVNQF
jgi:hypothetical protein